MIFYTSAVLIILRIPKDEGLISCEPGMESENDNTKH